MVIYPVSTSKFGLGDWPGSYRTPLGELEVTQKIGDGLARSTADSPGRDPIVTRIIWLRGCEPQNANAFVRDIYIHETPEERNIGLPVSYGCVRMRSSDIVNLFDIVGGKQMITATYSWRAFCSSKGRACDSSGRSIYRSE